MSLITVDLRDRKQLYEQLTDNVKKLILTGELKPDDKLPSVRSLAKELGINPNTIQKAYSELERTGIIMTLPGRGSIVLADRSILRSDQMEELTARFFAIATECANTGVTESEFINAAQTAWKRTGGGKE